MTELDVLRGALRPLRQSAAGDEELLARLGGARLVFLGEATHGTREFYRERARLTRRLIEERSFDGVAIEGDWPDAYRVHRFVTGHRDGEERDTHASMALCGFRRFPAWMWRNTEVRDFVTWLRSYNRTTDRQVGFFGLDLYSLYESAAAVIRHLERVDPKAAERARYRYGCLEHSAEDVEELGYVANFDLDEACERRVIAQLKEMRCRSALAWSPGGVSPCSDLVPELETAEDLFFAQQNAEVVRSAEAYYRTMFRGRVASWNVREEHMTRTLEALLRFLGEQLGRPAKLVVWAHNSHVGDARATELGTRGQWSLGQLVRERHPGICRLVGLTTHGGWVTAAGRWDGVAERMHVRPARPDSYEGLLHDLAVATGEDRYFLELTGEPVMSVLGERRLERAIGVVYRPDTERVSHYFGAKLTEQFDLLVHFDETEAVEPLDRPRAWRGVEPPETFPSAL